MITQERLIDLFLYDPLTGDFTWRIDIMCGRYMKQFAARAGAVAGSPNSKGYWGIQIDGRLYYAHRLAYLYMLGVWPSHQIDHENRKKDDNRWNNIRPATHKQNGENLSVRKGSKSGVRGVTWDRRAQRWRAHIGHNREQHELGLHKTIEAAAAARLRAEQGLFTHSEGAKK